MKALDVGAYVAAVTLAAVWLFYPLVMGALASLLRHRGRAAEPSREPPLGSVSIVVATRDEPASVWARVEDCLQATNAPAQFEVIVALDRGQRWHPIESSAPGRKAVRFVWGDEPGGKAATLNAGVRAASGDIVMFTDTSQRFHPEAIGRLADALREQGVGAVSGNLELGSTGQPPSLVTLYWRFERWLRRCEAEVRSSVGVTGAIYAIRRSLWKPLPAGLLLDDLYTPMQIVLRGYRVGFVEGARAWETRQPRPTEEYRRKARTLTGVIQLCAWLPELLSPVRNDIWLQFLFHKLLRFLTPYCTLAVGAWCLVAIWPMLTQHWSFWLGPTVAALLGVSLLSANRTRSLRNMVAETFLLSGAVMAATFHGLRGRWDVWQK
ncbi:MAG: hypothetical protein DMD55_13310 [Gemmatimonadetes bacterium]|nr:MAG: hypothetical protein DMD55_13310 [Gemmatimonadota bacterium]